MKRILLFTLLIVFSLGKTHATDIVNYVSNSDFETGVAEWRPFNNVGTHTFTQETTSPINGTGSALITITDGSTDGSNLGESWRMGSRMLMSTFKNAKYKVELKARASADIYINVMMQQNFAPWTDFGNTALDITTSVKDFSFEISNDKGVGGVWAFVLYYGHLATGTKIWIDDVKITEIVADNATDLTDGNSCNGDFEADILNAGNNTKYGWECNVSTISALFEIDNVDPINGANSMKVTNNGTSASADGMGWQSQMVWMFTPLKGQKYSIEFKAKATNATADNPTMILAEVIDVWKDGNRYNALTAPIPFALTSDVQTFKADLPNEVTLTDEYTFMFWLGYLPVGESLWLDDIKIYQTTDNPTDVIYELSDDKNTTISGAVNAINIATTQKADAYIYTTNGALLNKIVIDEAETSVEVAKGIYIVQVISGSKIVKSSKVLVK